jgi:phosphohistidine phosphatase
MRRLMLVRHAKSAWDTGAVSDHARPLSDRGRREAPRLGDRLLERGWVPELVLCSDAVRAVETWHAMAGAFPDARVELRPELYLADPEELLERVVELPPEVSTLMMIGHNPGWEATAARLTGTPVQLKTATAALLRAEGPWSELGQVGGWELVELVRGREAA